MIRSTDIEVNKALSNIRSYVTQIPLSDMTKEESNAAREMVEYAISLEIAGDIVAKRLTALAEEKSKKRLQFSSEGWGELERMYESMLANIRLASNVLISDDMESARLLVVEKAKIKRFERRSRKRRLKRLEEGAAKSFETSDIHLETIRALRDFNGHISVVAYPILYRNGQLLETRLIENMNDGEVSL